MKVEIESTTVLRLTDEEAEWLMSVVQNPLFGDTPNSESETDSRMRKAFWDALMRTNMENRSSNRR